MTEKELIQICQSRNEIDFLYSITKIVAESDSIGEGYGYCNNYTREKFEEEVKNILTPSRPWYMENNYLREAGMELYELYLAHLKVIIPD